MQDKWAEWKEKDPVCVLTQQRLITNELERVYASTLTLVAAGYLEGKFLGSGACV